LLNEARFEFFYKQESDEKVESQILFKQLSSKARAELPYYHHQISDNFDITYNIIFWNHVEGFESDDYELADGEA
jgi:hypothetical protein